MNIHYSQEDLTKFAIDAVEYERRFDVLLLYKLNELPFKLTAWLDFTERLWIDEGFTFKEVAFDAELKEEKSKYLMKVFKKFEQKEYS
jgi:hypothetical protein